jgi:tetratricopeptide (TPR) repeat protein
MKMKFLIVSITVIIGYSCFPDSNVFQTSGMTLSNVVFTRVDPDMPTAKEYVEAAQDYEQHPEHYRIDQLFSVARGYVIEGKYSQAIPLYSKALTVQPTNTVCIREIGLCYLKLEKYDEAASQFTKGWKLGDNMALKDLANLYLGLGRLTDIKPLVPDLLKARDLVTNNAAKHEITNSLIAYSLSAKPSADKGLFLKSIEGLSDEFILEREDTALVVIFGLRTFGFQERADKLAAESNKKWNLTRQP